MEMYSWIHRVDGLGIWLHHDIGHIMVWHCIVVMGLVKGMILLKLYCISDLKKLYNFILEANNVCPFWSKIFGHLAVLLSFVLPNYAGPHSYTKCVLEWLFLWVVLDSIFDKCKKGCLCEHWMQSMSTHSCAKVQLKIMWHHHMKKNCFNNNIDKIYQLLSTGTSPSQFFVTLSIHIKIHHLASTHFSLVFSIDSMVPNKSNNFIHIN